MAAKSSRLRQLNILLFTVLILFAPFVLYYLFYFSSQKSYFVNRNFRLLTDLGSEIGKKVDSVGGAYRTAADSAAAYYSTANASAPAEPSRNFKDFFKPLVDSQRADGTTITITTEGKPEPIGREAASSQAKSFSAVAVNVKQEDGASWLYFDYVGKGEDDPTPVRIQAKSRLDEFVKSFFQRFVHGKDFDSVFVAEANGKVLYQWGAEELGLTNLAGLIGKDQGKVDFDRLKQNGNVADVILTDTDYKLFVQPVDLSLAPSDPKTDQGTTWIVGGLVSAAHLRSESTAISYTILIVLTFLFILVVLSAPFLKLLFMGPKDTLRVADIYFLAFSTLMGSALTTVFLLYSFSYVDLESTMDDQLKTLSDQIVRNLEAELQLAVNQIGSLNRESEIHEKLLLLAKDQPHSPKAAQLDANAPKHHFNWKTLDSCPPPSNASSSGAHNAHEPCFGSTDILKNLTPDAIYPYLNSAIWMDPQGQQRIKLTSRSELAPLIPVRDRAYFQNILSGSTWNLDGQEFFLEPVYSKATGGQQVILSTPVIFSTPQGSEELPGWVSALDIRPLSVLQTVLPTELGYGYSVIDNEGRVMFHSDESRNQLENFFRESDNDSYLRSTVLARESGPMTVQYLGVGHRLFVRPIPNTPWSLITFRDKQILRAAGLELIAYAIYPFCFYAAILLVIFSFYYLWNRDNRSALLWPYKKRAANYNRSVTVNLLLALIFGLAILILSKWALLVLTILLPTFGFFFHHYNLRKSARCGSLVNRLQSTIEGRTSLNFKHGYVLTLVTLLFLVSVLPMLAFFKFAYDRELRLFVGLGQISLVRGLEDRAERVQAQYLSDPQVMTGTRDFVKKRLGEKCVQENDNSGQYCDVYTRFFFNCQFEGENLNNLGGPDSFERFIAWFVPFTNSLSSRIHGLNQSFSVAQPAGVLHRTGDSYHLIVLTGDKVPGNADRPSLAAVADPPVLGQTRRVLWWFGLFLTLAFIPSALFALIYFVGRRIFLLNTNEPTSFYCEEVPWAGITENVLVLASSFTCKDQLLSRVAIEVIDLRSVNRKKKADDSTSQELAKREARGLIALNYFEYKREDRKTNLEKIKLLESLLNRNEKVLVASAVDLTDFCFDETTAAEQQPNGSQASAFERACSIFNSFRKVYLEDRGDRKKFVAELSGYQKRWQQACNRGRGENKRMDRLMRTLRWECQSRVYLQAIGRSLLARDDFPQFTPEHIIQTVQDETNAYYHALWETCSKDEKLTLSHLAIHEIVSSFNPSLRRLLRSGLVARDPFLRPINESFARFVAAQASPEKVLDWKGADEKSVWEMLRVPFLIFLIVAAGFLFVSQRDLYNSTLAFVSAFAAAMPAIFKFLGLFPSGKVGNTGG